ncbi:MAG: hypothetical protein PHV16_00305 [Candidatus Nanoarchaeia archaeon]|nr:hypothetical protein [Candidatus Nanoarchaeia archaeon]
MQETKICQLCSSEMDKISSETVGDTEYVIWKCRKCNHQVAVSKD